jgi:hypothetical protein
MKGSQKPRLNVNNELDLEATLDEAFQIAESTIEAMDRTNDTSNQDDNIENEFVSSDESPVVKARLFAPVKKTKNAIKAHNKSFRKQSINVSSKTYHRIPSALLKNPKILLSGMRLAHPEDSKMVNSLHQYVRQELLEVFVLKDSYRVGLRCVHCCGDKSKKSGSLDHKNFGSMAIFYPKSLEDLYRACCTFQRLHVKQCPSMPKSVLTKYRFLKNSDPSRGKKAHWINSAKEQGFRNMSDSRSGIMYCSTIDSFDNGGSDNEDVDYDSDIDEFEI